MSETPPAPVQPSPVVPPAQGRRVSLREIAVRQRNVNFAILGYFVLLVLYLALPLSLRPYLPMAIAAIVLGGAAAVFLLAKTLFGGYPAIGVAIAALLFPVSLAVLLAVNSRATRILRDHQIPVGLLGARMEDVP